MKLKQLQDTIRGKKCELQVKGIIGECSFFYIVEVTNLYLCIRITRARGTNE